MPSGRCARGVFCGPTCRDTLCAASDDCSKRTPRCKTERRLESLIFKDARTRIVDFIVDMGNEKGKAIGKEILVKHNLTHMDIANLTATSRQTVTTVLNELKEKDYIHLERNKFLIRDINALK